MKEDKQLNEKVELIKSYLDTSLEKRDTYNVWNYLSNNYFWIDYNNKSKIYHLRFYWKGVVKEYSLSFSSRNIKLVK